MGIVSVVTSRSPQRDEAGWGIFSMRHTFSGSNIVDIQVESQNRISLPGHK